MTGKPTYFTARGQLTTTLDREPHTIYLQGTSTPSAPVDVLVIAYEDGDPPPPLLDAACIHDDALGAIARALRGEDGIVSRAEHAERGHNLDDALERLGLARKLGADRLRLLVELCDMLDTPGTKIDDVAVREKVIEIKKAKGGGDAGR